MLRGERIYCELSKAALGRSAAKMLYSCFGTVKWSLYPAKINKSIEVYDLERFITSFDKLSPVPSLRFSALLCGVSENSASAELLGQQFVKRMKCSKEVCRAVKYLTGRAFSPLPSTRAEINREMIKNGEENFILLLQLIRFLTELDVLPPCHDFCKIEKIATELVEKGGCITVARLALKGDDLLKLGVEKSAEMGKLLDYLVDLVADDRAENTKEGLTEAVKRYFDFDKNNEIR